jgi:DNA-damage-inducible protein D
MSEEPARQPEVTSFDVIRHMNAGGVEGGARGDPAEPRLRRVRRFKAAIERAQESCRQTGQEPEHHFVAVTKVIIAGKGAKQRIDDFALTRYACYLIAQNGDPSKPQVARADSSTSPSRRAVRARGPGAGGPGAIGEATARLARVQDARVPRARRGSPTRCSASSTTPGTAIRWRQGAADIRKLKGIPEQDKLLDRMNSTELAANTFRMTQTREKRGSRASRRKPRRRSSPHRRQAGPRGDREDRGTMPEQVPGRADPGSAKACAVSQAADDRWRRACETDRRSMTTPYPASGASLHGARGPRAQERFDDAEEGIHLAPAGGARDPGASLASPRPRPCVTTCAAVAPEPRRAVGEERQPADAPKSQASWRHASTRS